jgi:hypothetical protein
MFGEGVCMTLQQIIVGTVVYAVALAAIAYFTRPTWRRFAGAFAGGAAADGLGFWVIIPAGEAMGRWHVPLDLSRVYMGLLFLATVVSTIPIFLVTWRIARRFGGRGLAVTFAVVALGPLREFAVEAKYPEWITFAPGVATVLAISAAYVGGFAAGDGVMRLVAGPARGDRLARWPWEAANPGAALDHGGKERFPGSTPPGRAAGSCEPVRAGASDAVIKYNRARPLVVSRRKRGLARTC